MKKLLCMCLSLGAMLYVSVASTAEVVASGSWETIGYSVSGQWEIVHDKDGLYVVLDDAFETKDGPDLHIVLSPKPASQLTNDNTSQHALVVGLLKTQDNSALFRKMQGAQKLKIPDGTDLAAYRSIAIHCVRYAHVWAAADLR